MPRPYRAPADVSHGRSVTQNVTQRPRIGPPGGLWGLDMKKAQSPRCCWGFWAFLTPGDLS
jgi:hypothetical protein